MAITEASDSSGHTAVYASIGFQIYKRTDGASPSWNLFWQIPAANCANVVVERPARPDGDS